MVGCWARAASGQTTTVRPTKLINSRRLIAAPEAQDRASYRAQEHSGRAERKACKMSALGQKQTFAVQKGMSALPPIATSIAFFGMSALGQKRTWSRSGRAP